MTDLGSTTSCPRGGRCESCGTEHGDLHVVLVEVAAGVACLTVCGPCGLGLAAGCRLPVTPATASVLVAQHRAHVSGPHRAS